MRFVLAPLFIIFAGALVGAACLDSGDGTVGTSQPGPTPPVAVEAFGLTYISGHLGSYDSCSEQALQPVEVNDPDEAAAGADGARAGSDGDCADDGCGFQSCEHAEINVRLGNTGETAITSLSLSELSLLLGTDDAALDTEVLEVERWDGEPLSTPIVAGADVDLVVRFRGVSPWIDYSKNIDADFMATSAAKIHVIFETPRASAEVTSPRLYPITGIDT